MKRLILLLILFVNLQIVITHEDMRLFSCSTASAQHMTKEGNDNCYLEGFGWYYCPVPDCEVDVIAYHCRYCREAFDTDKQARDRHEEECGRTLEECGYCGLMVYRKDLKEHYRENCLNLRHVWEHLGFTSFDAWVNSMNSTEGSLGGGENGSGGSSGREDGSENAHSGTFTLSNVYVLPPTVPIGCPAAAIAGFSYGDQYKNTYRDLFLQNHWDVDPDEKERLKASGMIFDDFGSGYKSELLVKKDRYGNILSYALSFAGTDDIFDINADIDNAVGDIDIAKQYQLAYQMAKKIQLLANGKEVTFVGHSLGGGLASLASMATGCNAMVFNPAVLSDEWISKLKKDDSYYGVSHIYGYIMEGDPVTAVQNFMGWYMPGHYIRVKNQTGGNPHSIKTMFDSLNKR